MEMKAHSGGTLIFGPKSDTGLEAGADGSGIPMIPQQQSMYPSHGYGYPNSPQQYPQQPYPQQPYPQQPLMPPQGYPSAPYPDQKYWMF